MSVREGSRNCLLPQTTPEPCEPIASNWSVCRHTMTPVVDSVMNPDPSSERVEGSQLASQPSNSQQNLQQLVVNNADLSNLGYSTVNMRFYSLAGRDRKQLHGTQLFANKHGNAI